VVCIESGETQIIAAIIPNPSMGPFTRPPFLDPKKIEETNLTKY